MNQQMRDQWELEERILQIVDQRDEVTRSDLQGMVMALASHYQKKEVKNENLSTMQ